MQGLQQGLQRTDTEALYAPRRIPRTLKHFTARIDQRGAAPACQLTMLLDDHFKPVGPATAYIDATNPWQLLEGCLRSAQINREERSTQLVAGDRLHLLARDVRDIPEDVYRANGKHVQVYKAPDNAAKQHDDGESERCIRCARQGFHVIPHARPPESALPVHRRTSRPLWPPSAPGCARSCRERYSPPESKARR